MIESVSNVVGLADHWEFDSHQVSYTFGFMLN